MIKTRCIFSVKCVKDEALVLSESIALMVVLDYMNLLGLIYVDVGADTAPIRVFGLKTSRVFMRI